MKKSVLVIGIIVMLVSASFISSAISVPKKDNKNENKTLPTIIYTKYFFGPVDVSTSADFLTTRSCIVKLLIVKDVAFGVFAWEIVSGKMYLDTQQGSVELGPGSSFIAKNGILKYSGTEITVPPLIKLLGLLNHITLIDLTELIGQAWGVKVRSPEPI